MGYSYPIQLTQWALASSSGHAVLLRFMDILTHVLQHVANDNAGDLRSTGAVKRLRQIGPLSLTGPAAVTVATRTWLEEQIGLRWMALTGLLDGGRSKLVQDVLILPITGFRYVLLSAPALDFTFSLPLTSTSACSTFLMCQSPGRGRYGNMGSKPITDPAARVWHRAQGSWRSFDVKVEYGKFCRTVFGMCKSWPKTQQG